MLACSCIVSLGKLFTIPNFIWDIQRINVVRNPFSSSLSLTGYFWDGLFLSIILGFGCPIHIQSHIYILYGIKGRSLPYCMEPLEGYNQNYTCMQWNQFRDLRITDIAILAVTLLGIDSFIMMVLDEFLSDNEKNHVILANPQLGCFSFLQTCLKSSRVNAGL